jgi:ADP-ribose pyrophosphatase YjhB (NUDIX family)
MENGESSLTGAIRETKEEAGAVVIAKENSLYTLFNLPDINQMYLFFRVELANLEFSPGIESEEVALFSESQIPWEELAFPVVKTTLKQYFQDIKSNNFPVRMFDMHHDQSRNISTKMISCSDG